VTTRTSTLVFLGALALGVLDCGVQDVDLIRDPGPPDSGERVDPGADGGLEPMPPKNFCEQNGFVCLPRSINACDQLGYTRIFEVPCVEEGDECCAPPPPPPPPSECDVTGGFCVPRDMMNGECIGEQLYLDFTTSCDGDPIMPSGTVCCRWREQPVRCEELGYACLVPDKNTGGCPENMLEQPNECPTDMTSFTICCAPK
jgi:hypothetical protein